MEKFCNFHIVYSTVWKSSNFPATLIFYHWFLREINFGWFQKVKNCLFNNLRSFEFWFLEIFHAWIFKILKNWKSRAVQMVKMAISGASKWQKLISRKIWVAEKSWNFHIGYSQLGFPSLSHSFIWITLYFSPSPRVLRI